MSQKQVKRYRRVVRKAAEEIAYGTFEDTLALPFRERLEICATIITRRRTWLITLWIVGFGVAALATLLVAI